jgi:hypothetical protein
LEKGRKGEPRAATLEEILMEMGWADSPKAAALNRPRVPNLASDLRYKKSRVYIEERNLRFERPDKSGKDQGYRTAKITESDACLSLPSGALLLVELNQFPKVPDGSARVNIQDFERAFEQKYLIDPDTINDDIDFTTRYGYLVAYAPTSNGPKFYEILDRFHEERPYIDLMAEYAKGFIALREPAQKNS